MIYGRSEHNHQTFKTISIKFQHHLSEEIISELIVYFCFLEVPEFLSGSDSITLTTQVGNTVILPCQVTANPEATVTWEREGVELPVNRTVTVPIGLAIDTVQIQDTGSYVCKATNVLGSSTKTIILEVQSKLRFLLFCFFFNLS